MQRANVGLKGATDVKYFGGRSVLTTAKVIADSGEGYRRKSYAIKKAEELFPNAELVIDD